MDLDPSQIDQPAQEPTRKTIWRRRLIGAGIALLAFTLFLSLISYDINEMGWGFLNSRNPEAAAETPCTNILGTLGLYIAGLLYYLVGAAAPYAMVLCGIIGVDMSIKPLVKRSKQWIHFGVMVFTACAFMAVQNLVLTGWAEELCLRGPGGSLGYLFGVCIAAALIGAVYSAILFLIGHAISLIYFARLTPKQVGRVVWKDLCLLWQAWKRHLANRRKQKDLRSRAWKASMEDTAGSVPQPNESNTPQPKQMPLPILAEDPAQDRTPANQRQPYTPAPQAPVQPRKRPPLVIPPRPEDHPDPFQPVRQPEPERPVRKPEPVQPIRKQEPEQPVRRQEPVQPIRKPEPVAQQPRLEEPVQRRHMGSAISNPSVAPSHGDNLLDLMEDIEDDIERSSYSGRKPNGTAVPRSEVQLSARLQAAANRHMGIEEPKPVERQAPVRPEPVKEKPAKPEPRPEPKPEPEDEYRGAYADYPLPPYDLLNYTPPSEAVARAAEEESYQVQQCLIDTFSNFNIAVEPGEITRGPSLTRYEFYPPKGLRLNRIANLGNDLMLATQTKSVNILAPIPGKNTVGVELENTTKESVYLRELLESPAFHNPKLKIPVALGKNVYGEPVIGDLAAMPHALVAGTTGSGKSVCINSMILSMLYKFRPDELRLVLVDPKVVEMQPYRKLPHLACPVVTNPARVIGALRWAVNEMEHRYSMFSKIGVRNFEDFNNRPEGYLPEPEEENEEELNINYDALKGIGSGIEREDDEDDYDEEEEAQDELDFEEDDPIPAKLPYIVIIIDELADLMMVVKEDLENYIARLTQKARAAGIHLVAATQTPRSNVVTGLIKANIPCRIALKVASPLDSRIILDTNGAENLLGKGDLIFLPPGGITKLTRAQGAWVSDAEIASIIKFCATHAKQKFDQNVTAEMNNADGSGAGGPGSDGENGRLSGSGGGGNDDDELYTRCVNLVVTERKASTSLLQRRFSIGYGRAAKIMDMMEARGVISSPQGATRAREVLVDAPE